MIKKSFNGKWTISILKLNGNYKVTRRIPEFGISETKVFKNKKEAEKQFKEWLNS